MVGNLRKVAKNVIMYYDNFIGWKNCMVAWRYKMSLLMLKTLEEKFLFSARPCNILSSLRYQKFQQRCCFQNGMLWRNVLEWDMLLCELPSFGQACSITIPMAINLQWKIVLEAIPCLKCSRKRILIAMTQRRKTVVADIDSKPEQIFFNLLLNRWCLGNVSFN